MGAAETVRAEAGASVLPFLPPLLARAGQAARAELGAAAFEDEYAAGRRLSRDAAIGLALGAPAPPAEAPGERPDGTPLGRRQAEVARLVAEGLSNRQIGERLFISEHTVDSHIRAIMNKLGFNTRAQIAAWTASPARSPRRPRGVPMERCERFPGVAGLPPGRRGRSGGLRAAAVRPAA
nr:hypothetical protein GCM10020093_069690 [Planobispora longispora]